MSSLSQTPSPQVKPVFKSKSEERRVKALQNVDPKGLEANILINPVVNSPYFAVNVKVAGKAVRSQVCQNKSDILKFLSEVL